MSCAMGPSAPHNPLISRENALCIPRAGRYRARVIPPSLRVPWERTAVAALFIGCFFAALPLYGLHAVDGPVDFDCRPSPWRCEVQRWIGFERHRSEVAADRIRVDSRVRRSARRLTTDHRIVFAHAQNGDLPVSGWGNNDPFEVARALESARRRDAPMRARLGAATHRFVVGLIALFFLCGAGIAVFNDLGPARGAKRAAKASPPRPRPPRRGSPG